LDQPQDADALRLGTAGKIDSFVIGRDARPDEMNSGNVQLSENGILLLDVSWKPIAAFTPSTRSCVCACAGRDAKDTQRMQPGTRMLRISFFTANS
jgi:hypothetical protein